MQGLVPNRSANFSRKMSPGETVIRDGVEVPLSSSPVELVTKSKIENNLSKKGSPKFVITGVI